MKTMKITRRLMGFAAAIMALTACSESEDMLSAFHNDPNAVRITAEVDKASADGFTRSNPLGATEEEQKKFNADDEISGMGAARGQVPEMGKPDDEIHRLLSCFLYWWHYHSA